MFSWEIYEFFRGSGRRCFLSCGIKSSIKKIWQLNFLSRKLIHVKYKVCLRFKFYFIKSRFDLIPQPSNPCSIILTPRAPSSSNFHHDRGRSLTVLRLKISINLALSCPSSNIPLFMSNSEDRDTPVDDNEQERDGSEATSPRKRNGSSAQGSNGPNSKNYHWRRRV